MDYINRKLALELRQKAKLTRTQLAQKINCSEHAIYNLETNKNVFPCSSTIARVAKFFKVDPALFFNLDAVKFY